MIGRLKGNFHRTSLRQKIIVLMSVVATIIPTTLLSLLIYTYYHFGIEAMFNDKISQAVSKTSEIATAYLQEHKDSIQADILDSAKLVDRNYSTLVEDPKLFDPLLDKLAELRNLSEVMIFRPPNQVIAKNSSSFSLIFEKFPDDIYLEKAQDGHVVILESENADKVRAILKLNNFTDTYLLVGKYIDTDIAKLVKDSQGSVNLYKTLVTDTKKVRMKLELAFLVAVLLLYVTTIMASVRLAKYITKPINRLVEATEKLKQGDYSITLPEKSGIDETSILTRAFNEMTSTLANQRKQLVKFNKVIDERRRFIEAVLSEITAGVIAINIQGKITLSNRSAQDLLNCPGKQLDYNEVFPEIANMLEQAKLNPNAIAQEHLEIMRDDKKKHFFVRIGVQKNTDDIIESYIVTFDDISDLVSAQRTSAWSDVARRIAHEIKNPLTPINLSAERLKKKYSKQITEDRANFEKYLDTIIRHVTDIGQIIEEFVEFARIPQPKLKKTNIIKVIQEAIFTLSVPFKFIEFEFMPESKTMTALCDASQISQVMINLLKNSAEAIEQHLLHDVNLKGKIVVHVHKIASHTLEVAIRDNGGGFKEEILDKICEPYVTTKVKGTGIGLAIVKKIIEDHGGVIRFENCQVGATITFNLKLTGDDSNEA
ncbi:MAG: ATP-binding protein [Rickettsiales bacterium]